MLFQVGIDSLGGNVFFQVGLCALFELCQIHIVPITCKEGNQDFKQNMLMRGTLQTFTFVGQFNLPLYNLR